MERHSKGITQNPCYAHIFFTDAPENTDYEGNSDVLSVDILTDQSPLEELRRISNLKPRFSGIVWSLTPHIQADFGVAVMKKFSWDNRTANSFPKFGGVKQISLVSKKNNLDINTFHNRYQAHESIARQHHGMQAYAQSMHIEPIYGNHPDGSEINAISELWFGTRNDWNERFYLEASSAEVVKRDTEGFIDFGETQSAIVTEITHRKYL